MAAPKTTQWTLEPHTRAKHEILKRYLSAWFPILSQGGFPEVLYVDGFAGPGRYSKGEEGSPIIALKAALEHMATLQSRIRFLFVEEREDRAAALEEDTLRDRKARQFFHRRSEGTNVRAGCFKPDEYVSALGTFVTSHVRFYRPVRVDRFPISDDRTDIEFPQL